MSVSNVTPDDPDAAAANRVELLTHDDFTTLPAGTVYVDAATGFTATNNGMTLEAPAAGTTLRNANTTGNYITDGALSIRAGANGDDWIGFPSPDNPRPATVPAGQVAWLFAGAGSPVYQVAVTRYLSGESLPSDSDGLWYMQSKRGVPFTGSARTLTVPAGHGLVKGDWVFATDGPYLNELKTEWRRVIVAGRTTVQLNSALQRTYTQGTLCAGEWPQGLVFRYMTFTGITGPCMIQQSADIRFVACTFSRNANSNSSSGWLTMPGVGRVKFIGCNIACGVGSSSSHDVSFDNCTIASVSCEQGARLFRFSNCTFGPYGFDTSSGCTDWTIARCNWSGNPTVFIYDGWRVTDCAATGSDYVKVRGGGAILRRFTADCQVIAGDIADASYSGSPVGAGQNITFDRITTPRIYLSPNTSGKIINCAGIDVLAANAQTAANWTNDSGDIPIP